MFIAPRWPASPNIRAVCTTRLAPRGRGASVGAYAQFNLAHHVGDDPASVAANRQTLLASCAGVQRIAWLDQVHGTTVLRAEDACEVLQAADASYTTLPGIACGVMTADCLPVLFCNRDGTQVAAAHAGWRGLCAGILEDTIAAFSVPACELMAWIGPAISQPHFEVGGEVRDEFMTQFSDLPHGQVDRHFLPSPTRPGHFYGDLVGLAAAQLRALGVTEVSDSGRCCHQQRELFYSYRRDGVCGRQLSLIYIK